MKRTRVNAWLLAAAVLALPALAAPPPDGWLTAKAKVALLSSPEVRGPA